jgi:ribosomal protein L11 methyltransferase
MNYIEVKIKIDSEQKFLSEILTAMLAEIDFESFSEENNTLFAYIAEDLYNENEVLEITNNFGLEFETKIIPQQNWNEEWEKNFTPIVIDDTLTIKAPFHTDNFNTKDTIIIEPKMSFGTGHHATTYMMCKLMAKYDFLGTNVLDMGCGTGILAIYAALRGAKSITAIDIDEWSYENTIENAERNNINNIKAILGDIVAIPNETFDFILANINLNILKKDIHEYSKHLNSMGFLFLSGFFSNEINQIEIVCKRNNMQLIDNIDQEDWTACIFKKM